MTRFMATKKISRAKKILTQASPPVIETVSGPKLLTARPDTLDFRDLMYIPTLVEVAKEYPLERVLARQPVILNQGSEGACTGFALAAVANHLLRTRQLHPDLKPVSPRMLYEMARRHDEWEGEDYSGSSARGAMKGWHKFGVCEESLWPYADGTQDANATPERLRDAQTRPLGAYFRVNHKDLVSMHSALTETGVLLAGAAVHSGWQNVGEDGVIRYQPGITGGHAFAIVGYDSAGFWIQNSWGDSWGRQGFGHMSYADWLENGQDIWVARLGVPVEVGSSAAFAGSTAAGNRMGQSFSYADLRPHIISLGNDGLPSRTGDFANTPEEVRDIVQKEFPRITEGWSKKRILLYAHGGLVPAANAAQRIAEYRETMLKAEVYPLGFVWHSDFWTTLKNILKDAFSKRRSEGIIDAAKDFMLDRLDDTLEPLARYAGGRAQWAEMTENAVAATEGKGGGAAIVIAALKKLVAADPSIEIHVAGHSAGGVFMGPVVRELSKFTSIPTCHLWAPACTTDFFKKYYLPSLTGTAKKIREFALYTLSDRAEQDDHCANIYHKSLLYLVSRAFEEEYKLFSWGWKGAPLLGMERFIRDDPALLTLLKGAGATWVIAPNNDTSELTRSTAAAHGAFDDDPPTVKGTLRRILGKTSGAEPFEFAHSSSYRRDRRITLQSIT